MAPKSAAVNIVDSGAIIRMQIGILHGDCLMAPTTVLIQQGSIPDILTAARMSQDRKALNKLRPFGSRAPTIPDEADEIQLLCS